MIQIIGLNKFFSDTQVLKNINLEIPKGEIYGLIGRSGSGKSTLLRCINALEDIDQGSVIIDKIDIHKLKGYEIRKSRKNIGMVFQNFSLVDRSSVYSNVAMPLECWGVKKKEIRERVNYLLEIVGLIDKSSFKARQLSGGQKQRVAIARALALNPKVLLCDEATSALDPKTTDEIIELLIDINDKLKITEIIVSHEMSVIQRLCPKMSIIDNGSITYSGDTSEVFIKQPKELQDFLGDENNSITSTKENIALRLSYIANDKNKHLLFNLSQNLSVQYIILDVSLKKFRNSTLYSSVICFERNDLKEIRSYLKNKNIEFEIL